MPPGVAAKTETSKQKFRANRLPEISPESWQYWELITAQVEEHLDTHFGVLGEILPDPLRILNRLSQLTTSRPELPWRT